MLACNPQLDLCYSRTVPKSLESCSWEDVAAAGARVSSDGEGTAYNGVYILHNHTSFFDASTAFAAMSADTGVSERVAALAKEELWDHPLMGPVVRWYMVFLMHLSLFGSLLLLRLFHFLHVFSPLILHILLVFSAPTSGPANSPFTSSPASAICPSRWTRQSR